MAPTKAIGFSLKTPLNGAPVILRLGTGEDVPVLHTATADTEVLRLTGSIHTGVQADHETYTVAEVK